MFAEAVICAYTNMGLAIVFMMMPLFLNALKKANLPRKLLAPCIWAGFLGYVGCVFPGSPNSINVMPTTVLGTTTMAGPLVFYPPSSIILRIGLTDPSLTSSGSWISSPPSPTTAA
jgi:H+/gluconate symporter-like permease